MAAKGVVLSGRRAGTQRPVEPAADLAAPVAPQPELPSSESRRPRVDRQPFRSPGFTEGWAARYAEKDVYNSPRIPVDTAKDLAARRKERAANSAAASQMLGPLQRGAPKPPEYSLVGRRGRAPRMADGGQSQVSAEREKAALRTAVKETAALSRRYDSKAQAAIQQWSRIRDNLDPSDQSDSDLLKWQKAGVHAGKNMLQLLTDSLAMRRASLGEQHPATRRARDKLEAYMSLSLEQREQAERDAKARRRQKNMDKGFTEGRVGLAYELTADEKEARSHAAILSTLRQVIKAKRTLGGKKITSVRKLFHLIDTDGSMTVDMIEFTIALTRLGLGLSEDAVRRLGKALDTDGGGTIDFEEFELWMKTGKVPRAGEYDNAVFSSKRRERGGEHGQGLAESAIEAVAEFQAEEERRYKQERVEQERKAKVAKRKALLQQEARQRLFVQPYAEMLTSWLRDEVNSGGYASTPRMINQMFSAATACSKHNNGTDLDEQNWEGRHRLRLRNESQKMNDEDALGIRSDVVIEGALLQMVLQGTNTEALSATNTQGATELNSEPLKTGNLPNRQDTDSPSKVTKQQHVDTSHKTDATATILPPSISDDWDHTLTMKLAESQVREDEDTDEWALSRMEILCRLSPLRLARKVMETDGVLNQETFIDHVTCVVLFIDYSRICEVTTALFKRQGLFVRTRSLASTLNKYLGRLADKMSRGGGDIVKFAGSALVVIFPVTDESALADQVLRATQLSLECIAELHEEEAVHGLDLTAHSGIAVGDIAGFLAGGVFNRSEYAIVGDPVQQAAAAVASGSDGETIISAEAWEELNGKAVGTTTAAGCWVVRSIKDEEKLSPSALGTPSSEQKIVEMWSKRSKGLIDEIKQKCKDRDVINQRIEELKCFVPGTVRNRLRDFRPTSMPSISELRFVSIVLARVTGLNLNQGDIEDVKQAQNIAKLIQTTIYVHDGNFMRLSFDEAGAVMFGAFGLPPTHENDPERAVACGIDICQRVKQEFSGVKVSVGIASGYCWLGLIGGVSRCEYTIQGQTYVTAAHLVGVTDNGVMTDLATRDSCIETTRTRFVFESRSLGPESSGELSLPGLSSSTSGPTAGTDYFLVSPNPSALQKGPWQSKDNVLVMKLDERVVDAESDTQEWAVKRLEVLSRLAPYRLLRQVLAKYQETAPNQPASSAPSATVEQISVDSTGESSDSKLNHQNTLWVANICDDAVAMGVTLVQQKLAELFTPYGVVESVTVREKHNDPTSERQTHQSWALVTFDLDGGLRADVEGATSATIHFFGLKLLVKAAKARKELQRDNTGALRSVLDTQRIKTKSLNSQVDQQNFYDRMTCAAVFIDISGFSEITRILFSEQGLEGVKVLASTLNAYLGRIVDRLTHCGGDVVKFAGDAALVIFAVTDEVDLATQALKATQLSMECIADLEAGHYTVAGVSLTAHAGIGVGDATGFLTGGIFNRSEYAIIGDPIFQIASAEPAAGNGETVISPQVWALIQDHAEGRQLSDDNWLVTAIKPESLLKFDQCAGVLDELAVLTKDAANHVANEIKTVVPGGVRNRLAEFTPTSMPCMSEFRLVTMLFARIQGLDFSLGDAEISRVQAIVKIIQQTIYKHDGIFLRFSVDDKGAVVMGCYGLPPSHTNDAERAVLASLDFSRQIHIEHKGDLDGIQISVGLTTGYCWLGLVGGLTRCEYTTHAPMINLAARLMCSSDNQVVVDLVTKEACEQTSDRVKFDLQEPIQAKGFDKPVEVYIPRLVATAGLALKHWKVKIAPTEPPSEPTHEDS